MTQAKSTDLDGEANGEDRSNALCILENVSVSFADLDVLTDVDVVLSFNERLAVLGDNGSGKSTLMRVLSGTLEPDQGHRVINAPGGVAYAAQNPKFSADMSVQEVINSYHRRFRELETLIAAISQRLQSATGQTAERLMTQLQQVTDLYEAADGYSLEQRVDSALEQLSLGEIDRQRPVSQLSGGQRSRLGLACVLCSGAQLLLLDEPTNDLDDSAMSWLERNLEKHHGALVVISHDRMFLQRFARSIVEVHDGSLAHYGNGYGGYLHAKEQERIAIRADYEQWLEELEHSQRLVEKNAARVAAVPRKQEKAGFGHGNFRMRSRSHGSTSKIRQAKSRIEDLESNPAPKPAAELEFAMPTESGTGDGNTCLVRATKARREEAPLLATSNFEINLGQRWLVTGPNGAGKTSLLKLLAGELDHSQGKIWRAENLSYAWLRQELGQTPGESLLESFALATDSFVEEAAPVLAKLGLFRANDFPRHPLSLSVGQRRRFELAVAVSTRAQLLLLDEPTNHLSPALVEQLEEALEQYPGTVITVTHDRRWQQKLRAQSNLQRLHVRDGQVQVVK
ncbi:ribosomal protection-like ABC-F family protein [Arthrobacter sp. S41]|uniref:ribosomal protection-like ABC-F family protein n=1 Tax=Arthrobacter sp. S41 TaxID=2509721 RepID=UPI0010363832|nr:ABC-F family ATP-binding cassette domain-containing protein [Arthrobacter sp. S41]TAP26885.1 ABC-F family ATP-binding cassette domain-containing protein [Arthrobacter sp. S41]